METYRKKIIIIINLLLMLLFCTKKNNKDDYSLLAALGLVQSLGDYWAKIYKFNPYIVNDPDNIYFIDIATPENIDPIKTKLILISGWDYNDRSNRSYPTIEELKNRALNTNWGHLVKTSHFSILLQNYEVFTFDYLTSDPIDINGYRLRIWLDKLFYGYNNKVIIFAHSMGGLVSRFALYYNERPEYLKAIVTAGTPYHGSPWASPEYQKDKTLLGSLAAFLTDSQGGRDLAWDNYDNSLTGASNVKLATINQKTDRDDLIHALYGEIPGGNTFASDSLQSFGSLCATLNDFSPHDCIVPSRSAYLDGHILADKKNIGNYDHQDINWLTNYVRNYLVNYINNL
ncbi:MAG: esterase [Leptospiraceae bacterium]|nr:MAG: esterase [Leptospiraceae bacterium]